MGRRRFPPHVRLLVEKRDRGEIPADSGLLVAKRKHSTGREFKQKG